MADTIQPYTHQDFPRFVFSATEVKGAQKITTDTGTYYGRQVKDQAELDALAGDWFNSPDEAIEAQAEGTDLDELRKQAEAAGIKVDSRWGAKRIRTEIEKAQKA